MIRWVVVCGLLLGVGLSAPTVRATTSGELYKVQRAGGANGTLPGLAVPGLPGVRMLTSPGQRSLLTLAEQKSLQPNIRYQSLFTPNDPQFSLQWNLQTTRVPAAWDVDQVPPVHGGDARIIVAVLDTGLASTQVGGVASVPDIADGSVWTNSAEIAGDGIDNDNDGYVDDIHGWNFVGNNNRPADDNGHGTHISGVIAAATDNNLATAGIAHNVTIMPLKVLDKSGLGSTATLTAAVQYALKHGASIINLSLGGDEDDPIFHQTIQAAVQQGVVVVAAAGNTGASVVTYPARYSEVISVGATNTDGTRASYSNYGPELTLVAPGGDTNLDLNADGQPDGIPSQTCTDGTCTSFATIYLSGTSQAASEVSAVAALLASCGAAPGNIRSLLTASAADLGAPGRDDVYGYGLVDASTALSAAGCVTTAPSAPTSLYGTASSSSNLRLQPNRPSPYTKPVWHWSGPTGATYVVTWKKGTSTISTGRQAATKFPTTVKDEGSYTLSVSTIDALGQSSPATTFVYRYQKPVVIYSAGKTITMLTNELKPLRNVTLSFGQAVKVSAGWLGRTYLSRLLAAAQPSGATIAMLDTKGQTVSRMQPFGANFTGTITATVLNLADGSSKIVSATNTQGANIVWYSDRGKLLGRNLVFARYTSGVNVASGDLDGDGSDELVVAQTAGPEIRVYSADQKRIAAFSPRGKTFRSGWSITVGDTNGDGLAEILATPNVAVKTAKVLVISGTGRELKNFLVAGSTASPLSLQALDMTGDGKIELVTVPQRGAGVLQELTATGKVLRQIKISGTTYHSLTKL